MGSTKGNLTKKLKLYPKKLLGVLNDLASQWKLKVTVSSGILLVSGLKTDGSGSLLT